ncbi:MAG: hypothetical protein U9N81_03855 [Bacillota bacterium]|nr:hypothetical protein [Bacillota bacterium]
MIAILEEAFKRASEFSEDEQKVLAQYWIDQMKASDYIEIIKDEMKWKKSFSESQDVLGMMADKALKETAEGKAEQIGWDEL